MHKNGGLFVSLVVVIVVFLIGTFFGYQILGKFFGDNLIVEKLSPASIDHNEMVRLCREISGEVCVGNINLGKIEEDYLNGVKNLNYSGNDTG